MKLAEINDQILQAVKALNIGNIAQNSYTLLIDLPDIDRDTPIVVSAISSVGGKIRSVSEVKMSLEDTYLKLVGDE